MTKMRDYYRPVVNQAGYILMFPNIGAADELLQSYPPNPYAESKYQLFPLGTKMTQGERVWRYCKNSSAAITVVGNMLSSPITVHADAEDDLVVAASTGEAYAIGSYDITLTSTENIDVAPWSTANGGKEGYVYINLGTGIGQMRKIKSHEALVTTGTAKFTVYDPWNVAIVAGTSVAGIIQNPYSNVVVSPALADNPVGCAPIAVTASYYFWAQSGGPAAVTTHAAIAVGTMAVVGTTAGEIDPMASVTTEIIVGWPITPGVTDNDCAAIFLTLDR